MQDFRQKIHSLGTILTLIILPIFFLVGFIRGNREAMDPCSKNQFTVDSIDPIYYFWSEILKIGKQDLFQDVTLESGVFQPELGFLKEHKLMKHFFTI